MKKLLPILIITPLLFNVCLADDPTLNNLNDILVKREELNMKLQQNLEEDESRKIDPEMWN